MSIILMLVMALTSFFIRYSFPMQKVISSGSPNVEGMQIKGIKIEAITT
jgi:hypothetical protein